jgi:hypothetical protein
MFFPEKKKKLTVNVFAQLLFKNEQEEEQLTSGF